MRAPFTPQSARRDLFSHLAREIREFPTMSSSSPEDGRELTRAPLTTKRKNFVPHPRQELKASSNLMRQKRAPSQNMRQTRPLQDKRFSLGKEILTIAFTASKDGREHTLKKKKRWSSPQLSNKDVWSSPQPPKRKRTPPPHALQQEESSFQVVRASL